MVVFDSPIIIDILRGKQAALNLIEAYSNKEQIATTVINKYEILRGTPEKDIGFVSELLNKFIMYEFNDSIIKEAVKAYKKLAKEGKMINEFDVLIVAMTTSNNETLITKDKDFLNFENTKITVLNT